MRWNTEAKMTVDIFRKKKITGTLLGRKADCIKINVFKLFFYQFTVDPFLEINF